MACNQQCIELIRWGLTIAVPAVSVLVGVVIGAWLTGRRERRQRRLAFIEKQLSDFYSPMLGLRSEIRMLSELRDRVQRTASGVWSDLCARVGASNTEGLQALSQERYPEFESLIEYDNTQLQKELLPAFNGMAELFRNCYWLAEPDTRAYYSELIEFVGLWDRWIKKSIPPEVIEKLAVSEEKLKPFYNHLEKKHETLRKKVKAGKP